MKVSSTALPKSKWLTYALTTACIATIAVALFAGCTQKPSFKGIDITGANYAQDFSLKDSAGQRRSLKDYRGKIVLLFFGYVHCPDVCPTTMSEVAEAKQKLRKELGTKADQIQAIFVSLDFERDTPEILFSYAQQFDKSFVALRPENAQELAEVTTHYKVFYKKVTSVKSTKQDNYTMDHSAGTYIYDAQGRVRLYTRYGSGAQALQHDLQLLLNGQ